jgi:hypothetical protein
MRVLWFYIALVIVFLISYAINKLIICNIPFLEIDGYCSFWQSNTIRTIFHPAVSILFALILSNTHYFISTTVVEMARRANNTQEKQALQRALAVGKPFIWSELYDQLKEPPQPMR